MHKVYFSVLIVLFCFLTLEYFATNHLVKISKSNRAVATKASHLPIKKLPEIKTEPTDILSEMRSLLKLMRENTSEDNIENTLQSFARQLEPAQITQLQQILIRSNNMDMKSLVIDILSRNQTPQALASLQVYILEKTQSEPEVMLKAQAIDGISANINTKLATISLDELKNKSQDQFIRQQIAKAQQRIDLQIE